MHDNQQAGIHWGFWLVGLLALLWNLMGAINFVMQMDPDAIASYPESHRAIIEGRPAWATGGFAIGVFAGTLGCLLLLLRKKLATYLLLVSLLGILVTMIHTLLIATTTRFGVFEITMMMVMPVVVAVFLIWYARRARRKGWIG